MILNNKKPIAWSLCFGWGHYKNNSSLEKGQGYAKKIIMAAA